MSRPTSRCGRSARSWLRTRARPIGFSRSFATATRKPTISRTRPGTKTKAKFYTDDRLVFIVQSGAIKVNISGYPEFTATKGFMVNVPFRHVYTLETIGNQPSLRFEVRQAGAIPAYPGRRAARCGSGLHLSEGQGHAGAGQGNREQPDLRRLPEAGRSGERQAQQIRVGRSLHVQHSSRRGRARACPTPTRATSTSA